MINMKSLTVVCPFCQSTLPLREDRRGGRYFRCGLCLTASFITGRDAIEKLEAGGTFTFTVRHPPDPCTGIAND